ncbi:PQQ-binding-like beta-propeller repeat protein [uncultured Methanospirillum sp.]|uniref:beta-alanine-activating enzyme beta-propeller domain-containing protein n=1 Tax=uncultured Methanospirillum sp. TaxID=262503 RepID=UPI0029C7A9E7|nr:PQQ-binding-like beta-propeller repeat protein [uncultured Methanospirillum sp.]
MKKKLLLILIALLCLFLIFLGFNAGYSHNIKNFNNLTKKEDTKQTYNHISEIKFGNSDWKFISNEPIHFYPAIYDGILYDVNPIGYLQSTYLKSDKIINTKSNLNVCFHDVSSISPVISNSILYIGSYNHCFYAFDTQTGNIIWTTTLGNITLFSPTISNEIIFVGGDDGFLHFLNVQTGKEVGNIKTNGIISAFPITHGDNIFFGSEDGNLYAMNTKNKTIIWKFKTNGTVSSSPVIFNNTIYYGNDESNIYAINIDTGAEKWRFGLNDSILHSPSVSKEYVHVSSNNGIIYTLDPTTGKVIWTYKTSGKIPYTPSIFNNTVFVSNYNDQSYLLNAITGNVIWSIQTGDGIASIPVLFNDVLYFKCNDNTQYKVDFDSGNIISHEISPMMNLLVSSPSVSNDIVVFRGYDSYIYALNPLSGIVNWKIKGVSNSIPLIYNQSVIYNTNNGISAVNIQTGKEEWNIKSKNLSFSAPLMLNGTIYFWGNNTIYSYSNNTLITRNNWFPIGIHDDFPSYTNKTFIFRCNDSRDICAVYEPSEKEIWRTHLNNERGLTPTFVWNNTVYFGTTNRHVYAFDIKTKSIKWCFNTSGDVISSPTIADGSLIVGDNNGNLYSIETSTGKEKWKFYVDWMVGSTPFVSNGIIYVGSGSGYIYAVAETDGTPLWQYNTHGKGVFSTPAILNDSMFFTCSDSYLYNLNISNKTWN